MTSHNHQKVLTAHEVSIALRIPLSTVYSLTKKHELKGVKIGKHWRYMDQDIQEYLLGLTGSKEHANGAHRDDKRKHQRINCELNAKLQTILSRKLEPELYGTLHNISIGGVLFVDAGGNSTITIDDPVTVGFQLPGEEPRWVEIEGRIVRSTKGRATRLHRDESYAFGVKFKKLPPSIEDIIKTYVG